MLEYAVKDILLMKQRTKKLFEGCHIRMCCLCLIYANILFYIANVRSVESILCC